MSLFGVFYFNKKKYANTESIRNRYHTSNGYVYFDVEWFKINSHLKLLLVESSRGNHEVSYEISEGFGREFSSKQKDLDFFLKCLSDREKAFSWGIRLDTDNNQICLARNPFGTFPLYYKYSRNQFLAFATDLPALLNIIAEINGEFPDLNLRRINNYLVGSLLGKSTCYSDETIYADIKSVLPGHIAKFDSQNCQQKLYHFYNPSRWDYLTSTQDYAEVFREKLSKSVSRFCDNKQIIGSHLSGGLDSSSVSALIRNQAPHATLHTFFKATDTIHTNEGTYAQDVSAFIESKHHIVRPSYEELDAVILHTSLYGQPDQMMASPALQRDTIQRANQENCQILFTGLDGDGITGYGWKYITQLINQKNWLELRDALDRASELQYTLGISRGSLKKRKQKLYAHHLHTFFSKSLKSKSFKDAISAISRGRQHFHLSPFFFLNKLAENIANKLLTEDSFHIQSTYLEKSLKSNQSENVLTHIAHFDKESRSYYSDILFDSTIRALEELYVIGRHFNVSVVHPFYDADLYELNLAVPQSIKYANGLLRGHLREAMRGILPENVRTRTDKAIFDLYYKKSTLELYNQSRDFLIDSAPIWYYVDRSKFRSALKALTLTDDLKGTAKRCIVINQTIFLAVFLDVHKRNAFIVRRY